MNVVGWFFITAGLIGLCREVVRDYLKSILP